MNEAVSWRDYNTWDYSNPVYINPLIGKDEMMRLLSKAFWRFYINPLVWLRNAKELFLLRQSPYKYWLGLKGVLLSLFKLRAA